MEIRIGLQNTARELSFESKQTAIEVEKVVESALSAGSSQLKMTDEKGRVYIVPVQAIAFVEIGAEWARRVGFLA
jgi:hypothetical protein